MSWPILQALTQQEQQPKGATMTYIATVQDQSHTATTDHGAVLGAYAKAVLAHGWASHYYPVLVTDGQGEVCYINKSFYEYQNQIN